MRVFHVAGPSGSGKSRLLEAVIPIIQPAIVVKWTHHPLGQEKPGSDTARFAERGALSLLAAPDGLVLRPAPLDRATVYGILAQVLPADAVIMVEGDKTAPHPKIWVGPGLPDDVSASLVLGPVQPDRSAWLDVPLPLDGQTLVSCSNFLAEHWEEYTYSLGDADE